jgi:hypothetical protein
LRHIDEDQFRRLLHEETLVVEFEPVQARRSLGKLVRNAGDREKLNRVFDSLAADPSLDAKQQALLVELRKLVPRPAPEAAHPARKRATRFSAPPGRKAKRPSARAAAAARAE